MSDVEAARQRLRELRWSDDAIRLGERAGFRCEYCFRDLLASVDDYDAWQVDHIWPTSRGGARGFENQAVACKTCNFLKRAWIPQLSGDAPEAPPREALIGVVRAHIADKRCKKLEEVAAIRCAARQLMRDEDV